METESDAQAGGANSRAPEIGSEPASEAPNAFEAIDTTTPVLVLTSLSAARGAPRSFNATLGVARSLGRLGIPVHAVDTNPRGPSASSRFLRRRFVLDLTPSPTPEETVEHLLEAGRRIGPRAMLIPTWDDVSIQVADAYHALQEQFLLPRQPHGLARALASKKGMHRLAIEHGVPTPLASFPTSIDDVHAYAASATFPVMIKGIFGNRLAERVGRTLFLAERPHDLIRLCHEIEDFIDPNIMLQEYIPGGDESVWMFNGYFDADSECLYGMTGQKVRQWPPHAGTTTLGVCRTNETVLSQTRRWMKAIGYRGMIDMGYRYDARDGQYKILDVNPRIGSTFRLFVGRNGLDVVRAQYLDLTGQPVPADGAVDGRKWMDERDVLSGLSYWRNGEISLREWATSLRGLSELVYGASDDLAPLPRLALYFAERRARRILS